jgi:hypothetical protein
MKRGMQGPKRLGFPAKVHPSALIPIRHKNAVGLQDAIGHLAAFSGFAVRQGDGLAIRHPTPPQSATNR